MKNKDSFSVNTACDCLLAQLSGAPSIQHFTKRFIKHFQNYFPTQKVAIYLKGFPEPRLQLYDQSEKAARVTATWTHILEDISAQFKQESTIAKLIHHAEKNEHGYGVIIPDFGFFIFQAVIQGHPESLSLAFTSVAKRMSAEIDSILQHQNSALTKIAINESKGDFTNFLLQTIIDNSPEVITVKDLDKRIVMASKSSYRILPGKSDDIIGKTSKDLFDDETAFLIDLEDNKVMASGLPISSSKKIHDNGVEKTILTKKVPVTDETGGVNGIVDFSHEITSWHRAAKIIQNSEERLQIIVESIPDNVVELDFDGNIHTVNHKIAGLTPEKLIGMNYYNLISPIQNFHLRRAIADVRSSGYPEQYEISQGVDGVGRWFIDRVIPIKNKDVVERILLIEIDITEQKVAEARALQREGILRAFIEALPDSIFVINRNLKIMEVLATSPEQKWKDTTKNQYIYTLFPDDQKEALRTLVIDCFNHKTVMNLEFSLSDSGEEKWYEVRISPISGINAPTKLILLVTRDITNRKNGERLIANAFAEAEKLLSSISSVMIGVSKTDTITHWNTVAEQLFSIKAEDVLGKPFLNTGIMWDWIEVLEKISNCRDLARPTALETVNYKRPDGKDGFLSVIINPVREELNVHGGYLLLATDVSDRVNIETQLRQAQKLEAIGQLAAGIAHEINTPIQYIAYNIDFIDDVMNEFSGFFNQFKDFFHAHQDKDVIDTNAFRTHFEEMVEDLAPVLEEVPDAIKQSHTGIENVSRIVKAMKAFSHPGAEEKSMVDINAALESTITVARNEWKYVAEVDFQPAPDLPFVPCLPGEINQVFLNIIVNAAHAIQKKERENNSMGTIKIRTLKKEKWVVIEIADNGTGITDDVKEKIFDPFFTTKEVGKGTGQGMAIAYNVVIEKHAGKIEIESTPGQGSTFYVYLPIKE